jgi:drug/metabolite transporter (DMT)-like permease
VTAAAIALVLAAAILHAAWNAVLRGGADRLWSMAVIGASTALVGLPFALLLPQPAAPSWGFLAASTAIHIVYAQLLVAAYRQGELGEVYPIARGVSPLLVTLGAAIVASERPGTVALAGVVLVSCGILSLARRRRGDASAVVLALATGVSIACYTVVDGMGARRAGSPFSYSAWLFLLHGTAMPLVYYLRRGDSTQLPPLRQTALAAAGGVVSVAAYTAVIWALTLSTMGPVSALRETSVLFAAVIGRLYLGEALTLRRLASGAVIALGACCLGWR